MTSYEKGFPITGPLIRLKAKLQNIGRKYQCTNIGPCLHSVLPGFKHRCSIRCNTFHGDAAAVPESIHHEMKVIQIICDEYAPDDIYNKDGTSLHWRRMPDGGLTSEGRPGQKRDKAKITSSSHQMRLVLIGYLSGSLEPPKHSTQ